MLATSASTFAAGSGRRLTWRPRATIVSRAGRGMARSSVAFTWVLPLTVRNQVSSNTAVVERGQTPCLVLREFAAGPVDVVEMIL